MNVSMVFETIQKGIQLIYDLAAAGKQVEPTIKIVYDLVTKAKGGNVTDADLNAVEEQLDKMIDDFNAPLE